MKYSNEYEEYEIVKVVTEVKTVWRISQDGVWAEGEYPRLKDAKKAIDNQEVYF